ncbi:M15 family metallopeptidase [Catellatospora sp. KI3]|uniref:M15 family metallopeptidase n=1 Tax=Catellatospora sp. KI3 TaxID=3041620 RepID=UPI002482ED9D|nr:M15 family metallopeptidase [Catellatospora sp. KI3]MDI1464757.1 M15 family metallopeptidase [Catellatospora sp. KI3]
MSEIISLSDPRVAAVPVADCGEPLVDVRAMAALRMDQLVADVDGSYAQVRQGVADRLVMAQMLLPRGLRLLVVEGYRRAEEQQRLFEAAVARLRADRPDGDDSLRRAAARHCPPPPLAPHLTGGAVDLTLCTVDGVRLWLGTELHDTGSALCTSDADVDRQARANRDLLGSAMRQAGLVNYPAQWWHWSYGDRYWALLTGAPAARYGNHP